MAISTTRKQRLRKVETLTSGTSWTVPSGVNFVNVTLYGAGGAGAAGQTAGGATKGNPGQCIASTVTTTPGASIAYAIGAGGSGAGGTTTFTGATSATGGAAATTSTQSAGTSAAGFDNGGGSSPSGSGGSRGDGGNGKIEVEYWV